MQSTIPSTARSDAHLWLIALGLSLLANFAILASVGFATLESARLRNRAVPVVPPPAESVAMIFPEVAAQTAPSEQTMVTPPESVQRRFARTTEDQSAAPEKTTAFIGERNTRATSDRPAVPTAPPLPSQAGIAPRDETDIETTQSDYQDGSLATTPSAAPETEALPTQPAPDTPPTSPPAQAPAAETSEMPGPDADRSAPPPPREKLLEGPNPVDVPVQRDLTKDEEIKPTVEKRPPAGPPPAAKPTEASKTADAPKPKPSQEPTFKGFQRKTAVMGSISRTGRSSLDVEDSPLGRYQAAISRAVEQEWQRNCVRHRDFITPGFLTVRFFVETGGKVRSVQFVGDMETGEVQKGFTLNSIRDADIPAMPTALRKEYDKEPLELVFRFYF